MLYALQSSWLPYEHPRGGALKKVRIAVTGSHVTCGTLAWSHWAAMAAVGWCVGHVGGRGRGGQVALYGSLERRIGHASRGWLAGRLAAGWILQSYDLVFSDFQQIS